MPSFNTNSASGPGIKTTNRPNRWNASQSTSIVTYTTNDTSTRNARTIIKRMLGLTNVTTGSPFVVA